VIIGDADTRRRTAGGTRFAEVAESPVRSRHSRPFDADTKLWGSALGKKAGVVRGACPNILVSLAWAPGTRASPLLSTVDWGFRKWPEAVGIFRVLDGHASEAPCLYLSARGRKHGQHRKRRRTRGFFTEGVEVVSVDGTEERDLSAGRISRRAERLDEKSPSSRASISCKTRFTHHTAGREKLGGMKETGHSTSCVAGELCW